MKNTKFQLNLVFSKIMLNLNEKLKIAVDALALACLAAAKVSLRALATSRATFSICLMKNFKNYKMAKSGP